MNSLAITSINIETSLIPRFSSCSNFQQIEVFADVGFGLENKDLSAIDGLWHSDLKIKKLDYLKENTSNYSYIFNSPPINTSSLNNIAQANYLENSSIFNFLKEDINYKRDSSIPVIMNFSLTPFSNKLLTQLRLREIFLNQGLKILHIGSKKLGCILNYIDFPQRLFTCPVKQIEEWCKQLQLLGQLYQANIILLGIPGGLHSVKEFDNHTLIEILYNILCPKITIVNTPFCLQLNDLDNAYQMLKDYNHINADIFNMSNIIIDWKKSDISKNKYDYYTIPVEENSNLFSFSTGTSPWKYFSIYSDTALKDMGRYILQKI